MRLTITIDTEDAPNAETQAVILETIQTSCAILGKGLGLKINVECVDSDTGREYKTGADIRVTEEQ